ncbi:DUF397 domain-containing protein [Cryptosporangium sp. NPDC048952]|uniref:DUF397 domain-containing protein n=1 Tax=Cryptosporangium sp. NPDC048952 TaxID=3363961 RepID=UPI003716F754
MSSHSGTEAPAYRKSSFSGDQNCVEVATNMAQVYVRDTKDPDCVELKLPRPSWLGFLAACRRGEFNS